MTDITKHTAQNAEEKAAAALRDLEQAWAYFTPTAKTPAREDHPAEGYAPYYEAA